MSEAPEIRTPRRRVWPAGVGVGVVVVALAGGGLWWALHEPPPPPVSVVASAEPPKTRPNIPSGAMSTIPGGTVRMGSDKGDADEKPITERGQASFEIDVLEVTVAEFEACVQGGKCTEPVRAEGKCNWGRPDRRDHPVNCVDQAQAEAYCASLGKRLPSETEWEMAAGTAGAPIHGATRLRGQLCWNVPGNDVAGKRDSTCVSPTPADDAGGRARPGRHVWSGPPAVLPVRDVSCATSRVFRGGASTTRPPGTCAARPHQGSRRCARQPRFRCARAAPPGLSARRRSAAPPARRPALLGRDVRWSGGWSASRRRSSAARARGRTRAGPDVACPGAGRGADAAAVGTRRAETRPGAAPYLEPSRSMAATRRYLALGELHERA